MKKSLLILIPAAILITVISFALKSTLDKNNSLVVENKNIDFKSIPYYMDGESINLGVNGFSYFGNEIKKDLNSDGVDDVAFLFTKTSDGSGLFYYVAAAIKSNNGYVGTNSIFIGDRISPQSTNFADGKIIVNYADRKIDEPFTTSPSVGVSKELAVENNKLIEVTNAYKLRSKTWTWVKTEYNSEKVVEPKNKDAFKITFDNNSGITIKTDCNNGFGKYTLENIDRISFGEIGATEMYCDGSQESEFFKELSTISGYMFNSLGDLILQVKYDSGVMIFR